MHFCKFMTFRQIIGVQRAFLLSSSSQLPSAQNNPYLQVAFWELKYSNAILKPGPRWYPEH